MKLEMALLEVTSKGHLHLDSMFGLLALQATASNLPHDMLTEKRGVDEVQGSGVQNNFSASR